VRKRKRRQERNRLAAGAADAAANRDPVNREYIFTVFDQLAFHNRARGLDAEPVGTVIQLEITDEMGLLLHSFWGSGTMGGGYCPPPVTVQGGHPEERCQNPG